MSDYNSPIAHYRLNEWTISNLGLKTLQDQERVLQEIVDEVRFYPYFPFLFLPICYVCCTGYAFRTSTILFHPLLSFYSVVYVTYAYAGQRPWSVDCAVSSDCCTGSFFLGS
jgi:hypothetical protein